MFPTDVEHNINPTAKTMVPIREIMRCGITSPNLLDDLQPASDYHQLPNSQQVHFQIFCMGR